MPNSKQEKHKVDRRSREASELAKICKRELEVSLRRFGEHPFFDRGPHEVMDIDALAERFRVAGIDASVEAFGELIVDKRFGERLASSILEQLDSWDELWDEHGDFLASFR